MQGAGLTTPRSSALPHGRGLIAQGRARCAFITSSTLRGWLASRASLVWTLSGHGWQKKWRIWIRWGPSCPWWAWTTHRWLCRPWTSTDQASSASWTKCKRSAGPSPGTAAAAGTDPRLYLQQVRAASTCTGRRIFLSLKIKNLLLGGCDPGGLFLLQDSVIFHKNPWEQINMFCFMWLVHNFLVISQEGIWKEWCYLALIIEKSLPILLMIHVWQYLWTLYVSFWLFTAQQNDNKGFKVSPSRTFSSLYGCAVHSCWEMRFISVTAQLAECVKSKWFHRFVTVNNFRDLRF